MTIVEQTRPDTEHRAPDGPGPVDRRGLCFTPPTEGLDVYDALEWGRRDATVTRPDGSVVFRQDGTEFPRSWSQTAVDIAAQKYFRGHLGTPGRESSLRQLIDRVADTISDWGVADGHIQPTSRDGFAARLKSLLVNQQAAFNSPVWFNIGVEGVPQQASACFILSVDDTMDSILGWYVTEGQIFKRGSGAGVNLSRVRAAGEPLGGGGEASGPVTFMRGADASAGTIRSGGKTRRAAKMVLLDVDHPDVVDFVECKVREERKARVLEEAGFDMGFDSPDATLQYQNANNSVRLTDEFMRAALAGAPWRLRGRVSDAVSREIDAAELLDRIAQAAWECADPGVHFTDTINGWHTTPAEGAITASNPCSEYLSLDNTACNLASLNLVAFLDGNRLDVAAFRDAVRVMIVAQDVLVGRADYPTQLIAERTRRYRQLGLGFSNLGGALMHLGLAYDSAEARDWAAAVTALMAGTAYETSGEMAAALGPFEGFAKDAPGTRSVLERHRSEAHRLVERAEDPRIGDICSQASAAWDAAVAYASRRGVRNAQATVLAPTGTISFMMDCATTGIEPTFGLLTKKDLAGGGTITIASPAVPAALEALGYASGSTGEIVDHLAAGRPITTAPGLLPAHHDVFAGAVGPGPVVSAQGHLEMMAACQPFLSGAISKTVNLPEDATAAEMRDLIVTSWELGLKAVAFYRNNCKVSQPLSVATENDTQEGGLAEPSKLVVPVVEFRQARETLPRTRNSRIVEFRVTDCHGYMTVGEYDDGRPGEIYFTVSKQGSTLAGIMDCFAISVSHGLQHGVPLRSYVEAFTNVRFEPAGLTDDPELRIATSIVDYIFRRLALDYLDPAERVEMGVLSVAERTAPTLPGVAEAVEQSAGSGAMVAPLCMTCGDSMVRAGSCFACRSCGATSGCG